MCRIAGIIDFDNPTACLAINAMRDAMTHGGPDDAGTYTNHEWPLAMAVRRLALLDLSPAGHQPMASPSEDVVLAFNGEIYNFEEIKATLVAAGCRFHSQSDTEVVLQAYQYWGTDCFARLNGMFAMAIFDKKKEKIILARDHAGMKPLYYFIAPAQRRCYFASETRAFKTIDPHWPENPEWRIHFLAYGHMPEPYTTLNRVLMLPKGSFFELDLRNFSVQQHIWHIPSTNHHTLTGEEANAALRQSLSDAVRRHLIADAPLGVFLSGGLDSSIIALKAAGMRTQPINTLSLDFEHATFSEKKYQHLIAQRIGSTHLSYLLSQKDFEAEFSSILLAQDQPSNDGINTYFICKYAKQAGLKAVLSGIGSDELFGGYPSFRRQKWKPYLQWLGPLLGFADYFNQDKWKRISFLRYRSDEAAYLFQRGYFTIEQISALTGYDRPTILHTLKIEKTGNANKASGMAYVSHLEQNFYLKNQLLHDTDKMSMWHGVEVRMPFLDKDFMQFVEQTPDNIRFDAKRPKGWLINSFKEELPSAIWNRPKMGFSFPLTKWMEKLTITGACHPSFFSMQQQFKKGKLAWSRYWVYCQSAGQHFQLQPAALRIAFCTLRTFSAIGGIEKFNCSFGLALQQNALLNNWQVTHLSAYDEQSDGRYFHSPAFKSFSKKRLRFAWYFIRYQQYFDVQIAGHINLAPIIILSKLFHPNARRILMGHGIEMWQPLPWMKRKALQSLQEVWSVSKFTAEKIKTANPGLTLPTIRIFPNTLDPYFVANAPLPTADRHLQPPRLLSISRLASTEQYKGYDQVISILPKLVEQFPKLVYVLGGGGDEAERQRINAQVEVLKLQNVVWMPGYLTETDLAKQYLEAAVFVLPSRKEGFGIVFLEAAWMGLPIVAGNADGSKEALLQGQLGTLIDPENTEELATAILTLLKEPHPNDAAVAAKRALIAKTFGFEVFKQRQLDFLESDAASLAGTFVQPTVNDHTP